MERVEKLVRRDERTEPSEPAGKLPSEEFMDLLGTIHETKGALEVICAKLPPEVDRRVWVPVAMLLSVLDERLGRAPGKEPG